MLGTSDRNVSEVEHFFESRHIAAGYLVPTETGLAKSIMDAHQQLRSFFRHVGLHDYELQEKGQEAKIKIKTFLVHCNEMTETYTSLYRPLTKLGDPRLWISGLNGYTVAGNLVVLLVHESEIYAVNTSVEGLLDSSSDPHSPLSYLIDLVSGAKRKPLVDKFSEWNLRLLRSFFSEASKGEEVFLRVDKSFLDQIGQDIGGDVGFLKAVQTGPFWAMPNTSLVERANQLVRQRKLRTPDYKDPGVFDPTYRSLRAPVYLPYLAALVRNDSETINGFYNRLADELKFKHEFGSSEMAKLENVWLDLEQWASQCGGQFGQFHFRRLGGYGRIGVPRSQSILKPQDFERLPHVFAQAQVRPGLDLTDLQLTRILNGARTNEWHFTVAFKNALNHREFDQPIRSLVAAAYTEWDGTIPRFGAQRGVGVGGGGVGSNLEIAANEFGLALVVESQYPLKLSPRWHLPAVQDAGGFELTHSEFTWSGKFSGTRGVSTLAKPSQEVDLWNIATLAAAGNPQEFEMCYGRGEDSEAIACLLTLSTRLLWILIPSINVLSGEPELMEGGLPASGPAYLLAPPSCVASLKNYLDREKPDGEIINASGIPNNWLLVCLFDCASLSEEQRLLPDGREHGHPKPHPIRFTGGRSIRRGFSRMYLPYDLPEIELDAPDEVCIVTADGIDLEAVLDPCLGTTEQATLLKPRRRFTVKIYSTQSASYELKAISTNGEMLGRARLKVAGLGGEVVETRDTFSLDNLGRPMSSLEGLTGALLGLSQPSPNNYKPDIIEGFQISSSELGNRVKFTNEKCGVHENFLDRLAQSGGLDYGVARDLLRRLLHSQGKTDEPVYILLELRRRGHLELSTTQKGHISRVYSVKPTLYSLPSTSSNKQVWAISGTLRLDHWRLISIEQDAWLALSNDNDETFNSWRLLITSQFEAEKACRQLGFEFVQMPCVRIADWSGSLERFKGETFHNTMESIGSTQDDLKRFNSGKGLFTAIPSGSLVELLEVRDLDSRMDRLFVLADQGQYAFVRDKGWGKWLAIGEFAKWVSIKYPGMADVYPPPITYESKYGTVWIPARVGLPSVLERVLILCSGLSPEIFSLQRMVQEEAQSDGRILLSVPSGYLAILSANPFYDEMVQGRWCAYHHVPEQVARIVAEKLGAVLDMI
jgi:hypothetical protein